MTAEKPSGAANQIQVYSNYKHNQTVNFLIGITPQGTVSFISHSWGGRTSDKHITEDSNILSKLFPGDILMADRGFNRQGFNRQGVQQTGGSTDRGFQQTGVSTDRGFNRQGVQQTGGSTDRGFNRQGVQQTGGSTLRKKSCSTRPSLLSPISLTERNSYIL